MQIVNLTPHPVNVYSPERQDGPVVSYPAAERPARVAVVARYDKAQTERLGVPIRTVTHSEVRNLPDPYGPEDIHYIVSGAVVAAARVERRTTRDLLVPGPTVRDANGRVVGCMGLYRSHFDMLPDPGADDTEEVADG